MTAQDLLSRLRELDVRVRVEDGRLKFEAPPGVLDAELRATLAAHREELLELLTRATGVLQGPRSVVPLKPTGSLPPLFARPGHNGDVFCYRALAAHLDPGRPLYGVEPRGLDGSPVAATVEEMAAYEVDQIRRLQAHGPYYLAGYCAGGTIAFESARQLAAAGEPVARLVLLGAPFPTSYRPAARASSGLRDLASRVRRHAVAITAGSFAEGIEYIRSRGEGLRADRAAEAARRQDPALANRLRVEAATIDAVKRYQPGSYGGRLDLFLPNAAWRRSDDRPEEWRRLAAEVVEHVGPDESHGDNMLLEPHVRALAARLGPALTDGN